MTISNIQPGINAPSFVPPGHPPVQADANKSLPPPPAPATPQANSRNTYSSVRRLAAQFLRRKNTQGPEHIALAAYQDTRGVKVSELKHLPRKIQEPLIQEMGKLFSAEWGQEDTRYDTPENTCQEIRKQMNSSDPYDIVVVMYEKTSKDGKTGYQLVSTASMGRRDNPAFDTPHAENGEIKKKFGDGWLMNVYTTEAHRRKGHAAQSIGMIASIEEEREKQGLLPASNGTYLYTKRENVDYYLRQGFGVVGHEYIPAEVGDRQILYRAARDDDDHQITEYVMRRPAPELYASDLTTAERGQMANVLREKSEKDLPSVPWIEKDLPPISQG